MTTELINRILEQTDLVDLIGEVVDLKKRGSNYIGLCPFHSEKTPSFTVSDEKRFYKCFGCGKAGNAITFMKEHHGLSSDEAIRELARKAGIIIPDYKTQKKEKQELTRKELAVKAMKAASDFYMKLLNTTAGKLAVNYFNKRGFTFGLIKEFQLGYSPDSWDSLLIELRKQDFTDSTLNDAGLIIQKEDSQTFYDRFRNRLMFPLHDLQGNVIAFGARQLINDDNQPKYINSPQTILYDKSRSLYGLYQGKNQLRTLKEAILVEGYADVLSLHQAGFKNTVASSGTSLTKEQLDIIYKYCKRIYMVYDADSAGQKGVERGMEMALERGFDVRIVRLPHGEDPDSIVQKQGPKVFKAYLSEPLTFLDFKLQIIKNEGLLDSPSGKSEAVRSIIRLISSIPDRLQHDDFISMLSSKLSLTGSQLTKIYEEKKEYEKSSRKSRQQIAVNTSEPMKPAEQGEDQSRSQIKSSIENLQKELLPEEQLLFNFALFDNKNLKIIFGDFKVSTNIFISGEGKRLFSVLEYVHKESGNILDNINSDDSINTSDKEFLTLLAFSNPEQSENWKKFSRGIREKDDYKSIRDTIYRLEIKRIDIEIAKIMDSTKTKQPEEQQSDLKKVRDLMFMKKEITDILGSGK